LYAHKEVGGKIYKKAVESPGVCEVSNNFDTSGNPSSVGASTYYADDNMNAFGKDRKGNILSNEELYYNGTTGEAWGFDE